MEKKKETKRFDLMEFGSALGREEMKKLMAGSAGSCDCGWDGGTDPCGSSPTRSICETCCNQTYACYEAKCDNPECLDGGNPWQCINEVTDLYAACWNDCSSLPPF